MRFISFRGKHLPLGAEGQGDRIDPTTLCGWTARPDLRGGELGGKWSRSKDVLEQGQLPPAANQRQEQR